MKLEPAKRTAETQKAKQEHMTLPTITASALMILIGHMKKMPVIGFAKTYQMLFHKKALVQPNATALRASTGTPQHLNAP